MRLRVSPSLLAAALAPQVVEVRLAGRVWPIPPRPASDWIQALISQPSEPAILPGLLDEADAERMLDFGMRQMFTPAQWRRATVGAVSDAAGRDWWQAMRLVQTADDTLGRVYGELLLQGVDAARVSFAAWCAAVYALLVRNLDEKQLARLQTKLMLVPVDIDQDVAVTGPSDAQQIRALMQVMPQFRMSE